MSIQVQVLTALRGMIDALAPFAAVTMGALPAQNGLSLVATSGQTAQETLAGGATVTLDVALNSKHESRQMALDTLCRIHEALGKTSDLPSGEGWQMIAVSTAGAPGYVARDDAHWLYGSALAVRYVME